MRIKKTLFIFAVAATFSMAHAETGVLAPGNDALLEELYQTLAQPDLDDWQVVERQVLVLWSQSGSPAMDLLLDRGRRAMNAGALTVAVEHFSALIDHAPDFAEGWNMRATAYYLLGEYGLSVADIRQTLILNPQHFGALAGLGSIYELTDNPAGALAAFRAAQAVNPHREDINSAIERLTIVVEGEQL